MKKPKRVRLTKALYDAAVERADVAEAQVRRERSLREHEYEPRPKRPRDPFYGVRGTEQEVPCDTWQERFLKESVVTESWQLRATLAESAHRAMAEALGAPTVGTQLSAISAWAGRGMQDKPQKPTRSDHETGQPFP